MITIEYCPKCLGACKHQTVKYIRGLYCSRCNEWGEVREFRHMHLAWIWIRVQLKGAKLYPELYNLRRDGDL